MSLNEGQGENRGGVRQFGTLLLCARSLCGSPSWGRSRAVRAPGAKAQSGQRVDRAVEPPPPRPDQDCTHKLGPPSGSSTTTRPLERGCSATGTRACPG